MLRHKCLFLLFILNLNLFASGFVVAKENIAYNIRITSNDVSFVSNAQTKKYCEPASLDDFKDGKYISKRYIKKGTVICKDDLSLYKKNSVIINFGTIQIEKKGKLIFENDEYIKIKKENGEVEKIYKDGRTE